MRDFGGIPSRNVQNCTSMSPCYLLELVWDYFVADQLVCFYFFADQLVCFYFFADQLVCFYCFAYQIVCFCFFADQLVCFYLARVGCPELRKTVTLDW